ncbi:TetR/AcrR family transcriptional regulator [Roseibium sp. MMSF_3544]|uniref:TetR/AcrR family transcriptional regulator n=1 Tax=unclassified Roseibium TaxID=2629323 RepID=UPI00273D839D|nr:TetR/AcrR family transcriptional regulator [Roseibium sp. MMSF_3544]
MPQGLPMREKIIAAAEKRVRNAGFPAMSFRDVAQDVGIKSASVHYHFPTKEDLGEALLDSYIERFRARLEAIPQDNLKAALDQFIELYGDGLVMDEAICLCAILGAEALGLPADMNRKTRAFFEMNADWLTALFARHGHEEETDLSITIVSALEGAIIVASSSSDRTLFEKVAATVPLIAGRTLGHAP